MGAAPVGSGASGGGAAVGAAEASVGAASRAAAAMSASTCGSSSIVRFHFVLRTLTFEYLPRTDANLALTDIRAQHPDATGR